MKNGREKINIFKKKLYRIFHFFLCKIIQNYGETENESISNPKKKKEIWKSTEHICV